VCECLDETGRVTLHASSEHLEVEYFQIPDDLVILALFSDLQYSTSKCSESACKVSQHFLAWRGES
jgi:hypothetical protein